MQVADVMSRDVWTARPDQTLREAAEAMKKRDVGALPVADNDRLVGMITDRDIAVRGIAAGLGPDAPVEQAMSKHVCYCFEDQTVHDVANNMAEIQVRRLPVMNRNKRLTEILALADIARSDIADGSTEIAICGVSAPRGAHTQGLEAI